MRQVDSALWPHHARSLGRSDSVRVLYQGVERVSQADRCPGPPSPWLGSAHDVYSCHEHRRARHRERASRSPDGARRGQGRGSGPVPCGGREPRPQRRRLLQTRERVVPRGPIGLGVPARTERPIHRQLHHHGGLPEPLPRGGGRRDRPATRRQSDRKRRGGQLLQSGDGRGQEVLDLPASGLRRLDTAVSHAVPAARHEPGPPVVVGGRPNRQDRHRDDRFGARSGPSLS